ncbi:MAG: 3-phosphoshikimate 1-carboxyvinyltransferase [Fimbriimonadaceae bacterium]
MASRLKVKRCEQFVGTIRPPSDKSLTHRAYMFAALAKPGDYEPITHVDGPGAVFGLEVPASSTSIINHPLNGEDCESTLGCLATLGASIDRISETQVQITPPHEWVTDPVQLDCGNSGTTMRLMSGILAGISGVQATLVGDESLSKRPMGRVSQPLTLMGADITGDTAPVRINGRQLKGIGYETPVASAQIKSAILLAALKAIGTTTVFEPELSRDHTERMFTALGVKMNRKGSTVSIVGGQAWGGFEFTVPGDISSAAFFIVAALLHPLSDISFTHLGINPTRTGILGVLDQMEVEYIAFNASEELGEPVANLQVKTPQALKPFVIEGALVPKLIDEIPVLAVLATQCNGTSIIRDAKELRVKETDRIEVVTRYLSAMGANVEATVDGMIIHGPTPLRGALIDSSGDHRIGMCFAIAGSIASGETIIENADSINTSYPQFLDHFEHLSGSKVEVMQ